MAGFTPAGVYADQNLGLVQGGIREAQPIGQGFDQRAAMAREEEKLNAPSTEIQQWLAQKMAEGWTPKEAAVAVKAGYGPGGPKSGQQAPAGPPQAPAQNLGPQAGMDPAVMRPQGTDPQLSNTQVYSSGGMGGSAPARPMEQPAQGSPWEQRMQSERQGGMTGYRPPAEMPRVRTNRDFQEVARANPSMQKPVIAQTQANARLGAAEINQDGQDGRLDTKMKFEEKKLKEKGKQFDAMMQYRYDALDEKEDAIRDQIRSRESIASSKQGNAEALKLLQEDVKMMKEFNREIAALQQEKTRAGTMLSPEQKEATDRMIRSLQKKADHLNYSIDLQMKQRGGRPGLREEPGRGGDEYPRYSPGTGYNPPLNTVRSEEGASADLGTPAISTSTGVQEPQSASSSEKFVWIKDNVTQAQIKVPAAEVEKDLQQMGADKWKKRYTPIQRDD